MGLDEAYLNAFQRLPDKSRLEFTAPGRKERVVTAADGVAALQAVQFERPDIIVLDLAMPVLTGWDVIKHLKGNARTVRIPIVAVSGQQARESALLEGADSCCERPCPPEALLKELLRVLREPAKHREQWPVRRESDRDAVDYVHRYYVPNATATADSPSSMFQGALPRVLVIDDDATIRDLSSAVLERAGFSVEARGQRRGRDRPNQRLDAGGSHAGPGNARNGRVRRHSAPSRHVVAATGGDCYGPDLSGGEIGSRPSGGRSSLQALAPSGTGCSLQARLKSALERPARLPSGSSTFQVEAAAIGGGDTVDRVANARERIGLRRMAPDC
jgi:CheY-like chemotaxis protein